MDEIEGTSSLKAKLFARVGAKTAADGFGPARGRDFLVRKRDGATDYFYIICAESKSGYRVQPGAGVRLERVERLFHLTSGFERKAQLDTATMATTIGLLMGGTSRSCEFRLESESEVDVTATQLVDIFRDFGLPYFDRWSSLTSIDEELNEHPEKRTIHRALAWNRCSTGIIVAKLVGRANFKYLASYYHDVMATDNKGFYLSRFEALLSSLHDLQ